MKGAEGKALEVRDVGFGAPQPRARDLCPQRRDPTCCPGFAYPQRRRPAPRLRRPGRPARISDCGPYGATDLLQHLGAVVATSRELKSLASENLRHGFQSMRALIRSASSVPDSWTFGTFSPCLALVFIHALL